MRLLGVDFSAAADAGRAIWIAEGHWRGQRLAVTALRPARELPGGGLARDVALAALRQHVAAQGDSIIGIDAPNALPRPVAGADWHDWLPGFAATHATPQAFRAACHAITGGRESRRACDIAAKTPFAAWNLRLFRQTWHCIAELYLPLLAAGAVTVAPFQPPVAGTPRLAEICPASTLKRLDLYRSYKGRGPTLKKVRRELLAAMVAATPFALPPALAKFAVEDPGGDALDALVALAAAGRCQRAGAFEAHDPGSEGEVYVWA